MTSNTPTIRPEQPGDEAGIRQILTAAFPTDLEARLVDDLRAASQPTISLVATRDDRIVGHIAFSPVTLDGVAVGLGLAPVAVAPEFQRQGFGSALITAGLALARQSAAPLVVILGDPAYYARFGFRPAEVWNLHDDYGGGEAFQAIVFDESAVTAEGGLVRYSPEFAIFDTK